MIPLPQYADWFMLTCVAAAVSAVPLWKWRKSRQESAVAESWDKFDGFMAFVEKGKRTVRGGFTLIELLIVISIMVILVALTATMMRPDIEGRRVREAARSINVYLASARNRATETGKPCGVIFRRFGTIPCAMTADQCEVPPSYSGDTEDAGVVAMTEHSRNALNSTIQALFTPPGSFDTSLVKLGDMIQLNHQGPLYTIVSCTNTSLEIQLDVSRGQNHPWIPLWNNNRRYFPGSTVYHAGQYYSSISYLDINGDEMPNIGNAPPSSPSFWAHTTPSFQPVAYRIFRAPVKGFAQPLQLPASSVVDLSASGVGDGIGLGAGNFTIMFSPNGAVDCVYDSAGRHVVVEPIFLLVGKRERVENAFIQDNPNETTLTNYQDLGNRWVMVNPQTGAVSTENVGADSSLGHTIVDVPSSRELAKQAVGVGGR